jgi:hypothetical protein
MQVTIDIPEPLFNELKSQAREDQTSVEDLVVDGANFVVARARRSMEAKKPSLLEMNINFNDFMLMTDDEMELFDKIAALDPEAAVKAFGIRRLNAGG